LTLATLVVSLALGIPLLVGTILFFAFRAARATARRVRAALELEGVILDSGTQWITMRYRGYRAPGIYRGVGVTRTRGALVLTQQRLVVTPGLRRGNLRVARAELGRFAVGVAEDGALQIHSDNPPGATGSIHCHIAVGDAARWVKALTEAGARPLGAP
jgi:hypothetical protein